jgi:hypothetical protein
MPRPAYIMFSRSGAVDQYRNFASFFEAVETVDAFKTPPEAVELVKKGNLPKRVRDAFWLVCTWMKEEEDTPDVVFESKVTCTDPNGETFFEGAPIQFSFEQGINFYRVTVPDLILQGFPVVGVYAIEAKVSRLGEDNWVGSMSYHFLVKEKIFPAPAAPETPS